jgi:fumarate hydratase subunit alpha
MLGGGIMREIATIDVTKAVTKLCMDANYHLSADVMSAYTDSEKNETSPVGREILKQIIDNATIASDENVPSCQDTGVAVVFLELGQEVHITGGSLTEAIEQGVKNGYDSGYLRKSMCDPFTRKNTGTNLPAVIHVELVPGDALKITVAPKGGGSENMSCVKMMKPADGEEGIVDFVVEWVKQAGPNPCPPTIVGVGIGGNFEKSAILAKKSLIRPIGQRHEDPALAALELRLLERINRLGIGPMGLGGQTTAFDVHVEYMPCHIASLPLAVNINCHASRHKAVVL